MRMKFSLRSSLVTGPEDARTDRLQLRREQDRGILIETYHRAIRTPHTLLCAHDHCVHDLALAHTASRNRLLHRDLDDVTDSGVASPRAAQHLDALHAPRAAIVGDLEHGLRLYHVAALTFLVLMLCSRHDFRFDMGRDSTMITESPTLHALCSSCAWILDLRRMIFP